MPDPLQSVEVRHLTKVYGETVVLNDLSFSVAAGEAFAVVGPPGSGKTTLARLLATAVAPTRGAVRITGLHTGRRPLEARAQIGYLPATAGLDPELTVEEYLEFFLRAYDRDDEHGAAAMADVLELGDLTARRRDLVGALGPAEGRRLGLARCLLHDPRVLILDEPFAELSAGGRAEVGAVLDALKGMGKTLVLCTRSVEAVAEFAQEFCMLDHGIACEIGSAEEIRRLHTPQLTCELRVGGDPQRAQGIVEGVGALVLLRQRDRFRVALDTEEQLAALEARLAEAGIPLKRRRVEPGFTDVVATCFARRAQVDRQAAAFLRRPGR